MSQVVLSPLPSFLPPLILPSSEAVQQKETEETPACLAEA